MNGSLTFRNNKLRFFEKGCVFYGIPQGKYRVEPISNMYFKLIGYDRMLLVYYPDLLTL